MDPKTGLPWIGDVGEITEEEISVGGGSQHYGYPFVEGAHVWGDVDGKNCSSMTPSRACTAPAYAYPRSVERTVTGGLILDGCGWPGVFGGTHYVFADSSTNWIRALPVNADRTGFATTSPIDFAAYAGSAPVSLRTGPDGSLYVVFYALGAVYRFVPSGGCTSGAARVPAMPAAAMGLLAAALAVLAIGSYRARRRRGRSRD